VLGFLNPESGQSLVVDHAGLVQHRQSQFGVIERRLCGVAKAKVDLRLRHGLAGLRAGDAGGGGAAGEDSGESGQQKEWNCAGS
jgi:hypothetical protein